MLSILQPVDRCWNGFIRKDDITGFVKDNLKYMFNNYIVSVYRYSSYSLYFNMEATFFVTPTWNLYVSSLCKDLDSCEFPLEFELTPTLRF